MSDVAAAPVTTTASSFLTTTCVKTSYITTRKELVRIFLDKVRCFNSDLTLLVGRQEGLLARKKLGVGLLVVTI